MIATSSVRALKIEHWELPRMRRAMPEVVEQLKKTVAERSGEARSSPPQPLGCWRS